MRASKPCSSCKAVLPLGDFEKRADSKDGVRGKCRACSAARRSAYYQENKALILARQSEYVARNADVVADRKRRWRLENIDRLSAEMRTPDARERSREHSRASYLRNREKRMENVRQWQTANPDKYREYTRKSFHRRRGVPFTEAGKEYAVALLGDPCSYCGGPTDSIDHITPIALGGDGDWQNLTAACRSCNASKSAGPLLVGLLRLDALRDRDRKAA